MKQEIIIFNNIKTPISYYIGVNKSDNFKILDYVKESDIWFHIFECTSCHVVVRLPEKEEEFLTKKQVMTIIKKGALLCRQNTNSVKKEKLVKVGYPEFLGFKLKNLYDFFMLFVVLCGLAGLLLYGLTPMMKKMMHGIR